MKGNKGKREPKVPKKDDSNVANEDIEASENLTEDINIPEEASDKTDEKNAEDSANIKTDKSPDAELSAEKEKYMRLYAEYENFRKRSIKERELSYNDARADTILKFLPVYDNLLRAAEHESEDEAYKKGVAMIVAQFKDVLEKMGVSEISAAGETFDPDVHNAVMHVEDEEKGENEIVEEFQKGFKLGDKVIRFSMVKVAN